MQIQCIGDHRDLQQSCRGSHVTIEGLKHYYKENGVLETVWLSNISSSRRLQRVRVMMLRELRLTRRNILVMVLLLKPIVVMFLKIMIVKMKLTTKVLEIQLLVEEEEEADDDDKEKRTRRRRRRMAMMMMIRR